MECDPALLELFRAEVETHMPVLSDGLLAMEKDASQTHRLKDLMRAAHSLKGAARLVGFEAAVHVAHALEDCFVAALDGRVQITSDHADVLLRGVDALQQLTKGDAAEAGDAGPGGPRWRGIVDDIAAILPQSFQVSATFDSAWVEDHRGSLARLLRSKCQEIRFDLAGCEFDRCRRTGAYGKGGPCRGELSLRHVPDGRTRLRIGGPSSSRHGAGPCVSSRRCEGLNMPPSRPDRNEFVAEAKEHLSTVCDRLLGLEKSAGETVRQQMEEMFRAMHSVKGGAGFFGLCNIERIAHGMESLLDRMQLEQVPHDARAVERALGGHRSNRRPARRHRP